MRIAIVCSDLRHPVVPWLQRWMEKHRPAHELALVQRISDLPGGDLLFLVSCSEVLRPKDRQKYSVALVIHASDLPEGRGWSPHIWQILEGRNEIVVSLIEAAADVDSGDIWAQRALQLEGHELAGEINGKLFALELELMDVAIETFGSASPRRQDGRKATHYRRRTADDSRLDPNKTIKEQFDLLRVCDPERHPAFFDLRGHRYVLHISKIKQT
jgi:methionyl-tRNA formyltransferase